jgi:hypothetical protein
MERLINGRLKQLEKKIATKGEEPVYTISELARQIKADWKKPYFGAVPYIQAMLSINRIDDDYIFEPAKYIVNYFLANAATWRGDEARRIKGILKEMVK